VWRISKIEIITWYKVEYFPSFTSSRIKDRRGGRFAPFPVPAHRDTFLTCCPHYPSGSKQVDRLHPCSTSAFPKYWVGRHPQLSFRSLLRVHSRYGLPVRYSPKGLQLSRELQQEGLPILLCLGSYQESIISRAELSPTGILRPRGAPICCVLPGTGAYFSEL